MPNGYRVDRFPQVDEEVRALANRAASLGIRHEFFQALKAIVEQLQNRPLEWGDPERQTRKKGGWVYHRVYPPLVVHYLVYEPERVVCILKIKPLSRSPLA